MPKGVAFLTESSELLPSVDNNNTTPCLFKLVTDGVGNLLKSKF